MTGVSEYVSLGEKVWLPPKHSVKMTRYGNPWTYVIRDVLYEATNIKEALSIMNKAHRTCAIHLGLGSATDHSFRMFEYAYKTLNNYDDTNYTHYGANHPKKAGIAYFDKHVQPSGDNCVGLILTNVNLCLCRLSSMETGKPKVYGELLVWPIRLEILSWLSSISKTKWHTCLTLLLTEAVKLMPVHLSKSISTSFLLISDCLGIIE